MIMLRRTPYLGVSLILGSAACIYFMIKAWVVGLVSYAESFTLQEANMKLLKTLVAYLSWSSVFALLWGIALGEFDNAWWAAGALIIALLIALLLTMAEWFESSEGEDEDQDGVTGGFLDVQSARR